MWTATIHTLDGGTRLGELRNASVRKFGDELNKMKTVGLTVNLDSPFSEQLLQGDSLISLYETVGTLTDNTPDRRLRFVGETVTAEESVDGSSASIAITAGDGLFRLLKRMVGKAIPGYAKGLATATVDRSDIAVDMINRVQAASGTTFDAGGDAGIQIGATQPSSSTYVGPLYFAKVAEQIALLSAALDGFDFELVPIEPTLGGKLWTFNTYTVKGTLRENAIFEFGTGRKNVKSYTRAVTKDLLLNDGYTPPPGFPDSAEPILRETNTASIVARGRFEDVVSSDIPVADFRQKLLQEHVGIRNMARQQITFQPHVNAPRYAIDWDVGDIVPFRAVKNGQLRVNGYVRIYAVEITIDDVGRAVPSITVIPQ